MNKLPRSEVNIIPSALNTSQPTGVASNLASIAECQPHYDGVCIEQMKGNPLYDRIDDIDKVGIAQKRITENAKIVKSKSKMIRGLNDAAHSIANSKRK